MSGAANAGHAAGNVHDPRSTIRTISFASGAQVPWQPRLVT